MTTDRTPDAVRSPLSFAGAGTPHAKLANLRRKFSDVLNTERIFVRLQGAEHFITGDPADSLNFGGVDPRSGLPRYRWEDRGDRVLYGYLEAID